MTASQSLQTVGPLLCAAIGLSLVVMVPSVPAQTVFGHVVVLADQDADGIPDLFDACPDMVNVVPGNDRDGDWLRDECDLDPDGDGRIDPLVR